MAEANDYGGSDTFTRTRAEFGKDAISALDGVLGVLHSLKCGYMALDRHPPQENLYEEAVESIEELIAFTKSVYVE